MALVLTQVLWTSHEDSGSRTNGEQDKYGWLRTLNRTQLRVFIVFSVSLLTSGIVGLVGMFFFLKWAAIVYFVATLIAKFGGDLLFRRGKKIAPERALSHAVFVGEMVLFYLVFVGPAKELFQ